MAASRFIPATEVIARIKPSSRSKWYWHVQTGKVPGAVKNLNGWGFAIPRAAFEKWIAAHPECAAQPVESSQPEPAASEVTVSTLE